MAASTTTPPSSWVRVTRQRPCPVCDGDSWCGLRGDSSVAICMRRESARPTKNGGWLHVLSGHGPRRHERVLRLPPPAPDFAPWMAAAAAKASPQVLADYAANLGVPVQALQALDAIDAVHRGAGRATAVIAAPMRDPIAGGRVVGVRLRNWDGGKWAVTGSRDGLFYDVNNTFTDSLLIVEGPTDAAAAIALGFTVIGRPSCRGAVPQTTHVAKARNVVIFADRDAPGLAGARELASVLLLHAASVRLVAPPAPHKDLRAWFRAGAGRADVDALIGAAQPLRLVAGRSGR